MSWPWKRRPHPAPEVEEARLAREKAERDLERVRAETPVYRDLGNRLRELREHNHFAMAITATFRGEHS